MPQSAVEAIGRVRRECEHAAGRIDNIEIVIGASLFLCQRNASSPARRAVPGYAAYRFCPVLEECFSSMPRELPLKPWDEVRRSSGTTPLGELTISSDDRRISVPVSKEMPQVPQRAVRDTLPVLSRLEGML
ncbi:MAG: hypothetical protein ACYYK0_05250 [Candidatus Eutrophobiaceae bacterium]